MRHVLRATLLVSMFVTFVSTVPTHAAEPPAPSAAAERAWEIELTPFLWVAGMHGQLGLGDALSPVDTGFLDILESLKGTAMADLSLRYRRVGVVADGVWLRVGSTEASALPTIDTVGLQLDSALGTGAVFFRFEPMDGLFVDPYVGARWWRVRTEVDILRPDPSPDFQGDEVIKWADPVFGARVHYDITERWFVRGIGDVGGGVSKYQWQFHGAAGYRFTHWLALDAGYRINGVKYEKDGFLFHVNVSGFVMGATLRY